MLIQAGQRWKRVCCNAIVEIEDVVGNMIYFIVMQSDLGWKIGNYESHHQDNFTDPFFLEIFERSRSTCNIKYCMGDFRLLCLCMTIMVIDKFWILIKDSFKKK